MKVFCINCKYHKTDIHYVQKFNANVIFHNCIHPDVIDSSPVKVQPKNIYLNGLNLNNDCKNYKRKCYKFWIKEK
jgi:C4-type Zn-finger protein